MTAIQQLARVDCADGSQLIVTLNTGCVVLTVLRRDGHMAWSSAIGWGDARLLSEGLAAGSLALIPSGLK